jgi:hypothetical protein
VPTTEVGWPWSVLTPSCKPILLGKKEIFPTAWRAAKKTHLNHDPRVAKQPPRAAALKLCSSAVRAIMPFDVDLPIGWVLTSSCKPILDPPFWGRRRS